MTLASLSVVSQWQQWPWRIDLALYDIALKSWQREPSPDTVVVAVDDASLVALGRWPWPRTTIANLFEQIAAAGPRGVVVDLFFTEPDADAAADRRLVRAIGRLPNSVLATFREEASGASGFSDPLSAVAAAATTIGHVHVEVDPDAVVRSLYLLEGPSRPDRPHSALALAQLTGLAAGPLPGQRRADVPATPGRWQRDHWFRVPFSGPPGHLPQVSAADVVAGTGLERLRAKRVFVGATAAGLGDAYAVPTSASGRLMPGVEIGAHALDALLSGIDIRDPPQPLALAIGPVAVVVTMLGCLLLRPREALLATFAVALALLAGSLAGMRFAQIWQAPASAIVFVLLCYPLWSWRRLDASLDFMREELGTLAAEPDLLPLRPLPAPRPTTGPVDVVQRSIEAVRHANERTRVLRRFVVDTLALQADGVLVVDADGEVVLCNARAQALIGLNHEPVGMHVRSVFAGVTQIEDQLWQALEIPSEAVGVQQAEARNADGRELLVTTTACHGEGEGRIVYIVNITDVSALKAAARAREEAMGFLSHDLRAPQTSILSAIELRRSDPRSVSEANLVEQVERSARRTLALAEAFVTLTRADHLDPARFQPVDLADVCREVSDEVWPLCRAKSVVCDLELGAEEAWVAGERPLLAAALFNLLDNAIKYSPAGGRVRVDLARQDDQWRIAVSDQGPGIAAADLPRLFERFRRLGRDGRHKTHGAGLGLVIVDTVVRKHTGRIEVRSEPGQGSTFTLCLPASDDPGDTAASA